MPERTWDIEDETEVPFELDGPARVAEDDDQLAEEIFNSIHTLRRLGGVMMIGAVREELGQGIYKTNGFAFKWHSFMPAVKSQNGNKPEDEGGG